MLDIKLIRSNPELVKKGLERRKESFDVDSFLSMDEKRRE